ncbi:MAG: glycoside hydrolase family 9 protein, partial [Candidatus Brocadiae bacterium]|nr:glycoside hydrolase family 9 protein [Candidatus Brocadiia bacterium]
RFWFFQRCGMELKPEHAGPFAHRACHTSDEAIADPRGGERDCRGGWHDAGDMNRYAPWTIQPVFMLLSLYRHHSGKFADGQLNLPESGNGIPDLLDEIKYELQWVRKMLIREGPDAGMVYDRIHQSLVRQAEGVHFYDRRHGLREPTDRAACALVADLAHAYMVYKEFPQETEFADACLADALLTWDYLTSRGDPDDNHYFTAAALLFEATGRQDAHEVVKRLADAIIQTWHGRINYGVYDGGLAAYCLSERPEVDSDLQGRLRQYYTGYADAVVQAARSKGYNTPMMEGVVFSWGSNGHCIAKSGAHLLMVNRFAPNDDYVEAARGTLHWLLGRNAVNTCMVTGHGDPPLGPIYHGMFGPPGPGLPMPPGYLPGGPTRPNAAGLSAFLAKAWRPDYTCWELTEPSITYQGSFTYLVGALAALEGD